LTCENLGAHLGEGRADRVLFDQVDFSLHTGEMLCIGGRSGAGKTTLLHCIAGLRKPDHGRVIFRGQDLYDLSDRKRSRLRSRSIAVVFQSFHLLKHLTVAENLVLPGILGGHSTKDSVVSAVLERVVLGGYENFHPEELSGGERQRVVLARALAQDPDLLLCDEVTANLDPETAGIVLGVLGEILETGKTAVLAVTHNPRMLSLARRKLKLDDGRLREWS